jgi:hypothetical protein
MSSDAQILAPPGTSREQADPRRWIVLAALLMLALPARHRHTTQPDLVKEVTTS